MSEREELAMLMSDISEDCWCAGWMAGNEYEIWNAIQPGADRSYGMLSISADDAEKLIKLAEKVGAWPVWDSSVPDEESIDGLYLKWVPLDEWRKHYAEDRRQQK
jgi:hypothetical protein